MHKGILQPEGTLPVLICILLRNMEEPGLSHPQVPGTAKSSNHFLKKQDPKQACKSMCFSSRSKHTQVKHEHHHADRGSSRLFTGPLETSGVKAMLNSCSQEIALTQNAALIPQPDLVSSHQGKLWYSHGQTPQMMSETNDSRNA